MHDTLIAALGEILERERVAIIAGKFGDVDALSQSKQELFDKLIKSQPRPIDLRTIQQALNRNQALFSSAIEGVKSARSRLEALREVREGLRIYDQSGRFAQVAAKGPGMSKHT